MAKKPMTTEDIEARREAIQTQIEALRAEFKELGLELERRRVAADLPDLEAQKAEIERKIALATLGTPAAKSGGKGEGA